MLSSLFQLSGSILLAYMVITRSVISSIIATYSPTRYLGKVDPKTLDILKENNYFQIGLAYLIIGYIFQIADFDSTFFNSLDRFDRVFIISLLAIFLTFLGIIIGNFIANNEFNKIDPKDIEKLPIRDMVLADENPSNKNNEKSKNIEEETKIPKEN